MSTPARPSREELLAYAVGKLSDADSQRVAEYIESDPECQAMLATLDGTDDTLVGQLRQPPADDPYAAESQCNAALARAKGGVDRAAYSATSLALGTLGEYRLLEKLGQGGMGTVYKALHTKLDRVVALKVIAKQRMNDPQAVARFEREMKAVGRLNHPGIVHAVDAREIDGTPVLVMEFANGMDLGRLVRRHGPIAVNDACELIRQTAVALEYAHENSLVHRDIKPSNLMLTRSGEVKILDMGLARLGGDGWLAAERSEAPVSGELGQRCDMPQAPKELTGLTFTGQAMGTADYMAPEQVASPQTVDIRADIYSLGCTLFKLLTGRVPFDGTDCGGTLEKLAAHTGRPAPRIADLMDVPEALAATLDHMLAKSPADRPATPAAVAEALAPLCKGHDLASLLRRAEEQFSVGRAPLPCPAPSLPRTRRWKLVAAVIGLMLLSGGLGAALGVLVTIRHGDRETAFRVPDGSAVNIKQDGSVDVNVPTSAAAGAKPVSTFSTDTATSSTSTSTATTSDVTRTFNASPSGPDIQKRVLSDTFGGNPSQLGPTKPDEEAIQGTWAVVGQSYGGASYYFIPPGVLPKQTGTGQKYDKPEEATGETARFIFSGDTFKLREKRVAMTTGKYQINPDSKQKLIDLAQPGGNNLLGLYKLEGDRLTLCVAADKRPTEFWPEFGSHRELLVLRRIGGVENHPDEKAILGDWHVVKVAAEKVSDSYYVQEELPGAMAAAGVAVMTPKDSPVFSKWLSQTTSVNFQTDAIGFFQASGSTPANAAEHREAEISTWYMLDPTDKPAVIDIETSYFVKTPPNPKGNTPAEAFPRGYSLRGIYRLDGETLRLRLALALTDTPRPRDFDSKLAKDQFEMVLSRKEPQTAGHLDFRLAPTKEQVPASLTFDPRQRAGDGLAWFEMRDGGVNQFLATVAHDGKQYVLLSTKPDEVLLGGRLGPPDWTLRSVKVVKDKQGRPAIELELDEAGGKRLAKLTGEHIDRPMAIVVDDRVVAAPTIRSAISTKVEICGSFDQQEIDRLADALRTGIEKSQKK